MKLPEVTIRLPEKNSGHAERHNSSLSVLIIPPAVGYKNKFGCKKGAIPKRPFLGVNP